MKKFLIFLCVILTCMSCNNSKYDYKISNQNFLIVLSAEECHNMYARNEGDKTWVIYLSSNSECKDTVLCIELDNVKLDSVCPYHLGDTIYLTKNK